MLRFFQDEKEKEALQEQIKNNAKCEKLREAGDELALCIKAIQDSGFSREEAMELLCAIIINPYS